MPSFIPSVFAVQKLHGTLICYQRGPGKIGLSYVFCLYNRVYERKLYFFMFSKITQTVDSWGSGANFHVIVEIIKDISEEQCWQLILQYNHPIVIDSMWNDGRKVSENTQSKYRFQQVENLFKVRKITLETLYVQCLFWLEFC